MLLRPIRHALAIGLAVLMIAGSSVATIGYIDQANVQIVLSGPNVTRCNRSATISAQVVSTDDGRPVRNQVVSWALTSSLSGGDGLSAGSTVTNRRGRTSVTLSFGPAAGSRTVRAGVTVTASSITVRCAGGLPRTSTRPPAGFVESPSQAELMPSLTATAGGGSTELPARAIRVERLGIDLPIIEGDGTTVPEGMAAHYPGTAWPGQGSNTYLYAHAREGHFLELWGVRTGDTVELELDGGAVAQYRVSRIIPTARWDDLELLAPTGSEILTLQTCLTYEATAPRFVVIAERVAV